MQFDRFQFGGDGPFWAGRDRKAWAMATAAVVAISAQPVGAQDAVDVQEPPVARLSAALASNLPLVADPETCRAPRDVPASAKPVAVTARSYDPVLVERIGGPADTPTPGAPAGGDLFTALAAMDPEALRVIATMSPEQIDALTLLLVSRNGGLPGVSVGAGPGQAAGESPGSVATAARPQDAPWVGDWSDDEIAAREDTSHGATDAGTAPETILSDWRLVEHRNGTVELRNPDDSITALTVEAGLVLGSHGRVEDVVRGEDELLVFLDSGAVLRGEPNAERVFRPEARPSAGKRRALLAAVGGRAKDRRLALPPGGEASPTVMAAADSPVPAAATAAVRRGDGAPPPRPPLATERVLTAAAEAVAPQPDAEADAAAAPVVAGVFTSEAGATEASRELVELEIVPVVEAARHGGRTVFRVLVDPYQTAIPPERVAEHLSDLGYGAGQAAAGPDGGD